MEGETHTSWSDDDFDSNRRGTGVFHPNLEFIDNDETENSTDVAENESNPPIDLILPYDIHGRILASLPLAAIFKACCVCKKWNEIVHSTNFTLKDSWLLFQKPWYFMFTSSDEPSGHLYDSGLRKWYHFDLPFVAMQTWIIAPSSGLVCVMDEGSSSDMYVCNPITRKYEVLQKPSGPGFCFYSALAFSFDRVTQKYSVSVIRSMQASEDYLLWDISIHVYHSDEKIWLPPLLGRMVGWRPGNVSIIIEGVLYILVFCTRTGEIQNCHGLVTYNIDTRAPIGIITDDLLIPAPCPLTCGRLMNLRDRLVMVGGIGRRDRSGVIKGIGIWVLNGREWEEVSKMPHKFMQGFGEFDDVFASSGGGDLIYIQSYGGTALLIFDMSERHWFWSHRCPMNKKFPLQIFSGFCFEPWLGVLPS